MKLRLGHGPPPSPGPAARLLKILGVAMQAVDPAALVASHLRLDGEQLHAGPVTVDLGAVDRVFLVAAGKAAATMAAAAERILGPRLSGGVAVTARCC